MIKVVLSASIAAAAVGHHTSHVLTLVPLLQARTSVVEEGKGRAQEF